MTPRLPPAGTYDVDPSRSSIRFTTRHFFGLGSVSGSFAVHSARVRIADPVTESAVTATVLAASFTTGNEGRDKKVRSSTFLDAASHPEISFRSTSFRETDGGLVLDGALTVRGHTSPIECAVTRAETIGKSLVLVATTRIDRYAHGISAMRGMASRYLDLEVKATAIRNTSSVSIHSTAMNRRGKAEYMPELTKVAVIYYSSTGTVYELANSVLSGAKDAGADVRLLKVQELAPEEAIASNQGWAEHAAATRDVPVATPDDMLWADAVIFGTPTRFGNVASQMKQFFDGLGGLWGRGLLANKIYSGFTATATAHGGQESTLLAMYNSFHHFGGIVVAPGYTDPIKFADGNPYGTSHVNGQGAIPVDDTARNAASYQGRRVALIATAIKAGLAA